METIITIKYRFKKDDRVTLKVWCTQNGITLIQLSRKLGIAYPTLNLIMNGKRLVNSKLANKFRKLGYNLTGGNKNE